MGKKCVVDRSFNFRQRSKWSEPHFLTSKFLLSKSVVKVIIKKLIIHHSFFPRHAQPSLLPVKESVFVLSLHKASQPSNSLINGLKLELINRGSLQLTRGFDLKKHHGIKRHGRLNAPDD